MVIWSRPARADLRSIHDFIAHDSPDALDVKVIRERTGLSQGRFALLMGVSSRRCNNWEQGRRQPQGLAELLLRIAKNDPQGAMKARGNPGSGLAIMHAPESLCRAH